MGIESMVVGGRYLYGDSYGYSIGEVTKVDHSYSDENTEPGATGVAVWITDEATGKEDFLMEMPGCPFTTYVEPR